MKDAMIKAGLITKDSIEREKEKQRRQKIEKKGPAQHGIHAHHIRTDCGHCKDKFQTSSFMSTPTEALMQNGYAFLALINFGLNEMRQTHQSSQAMAGSFVVSSERLRSLALRLPPHINPNFG